MTRMSKVATNSAGNIVGARARPLTTGCSGCEHRGQASQGYRHSVFCQRAFRKWLGEQVRTVPRADEVETAEGVQMASKPQPRTRLRTKTTPPAPETSRPSAETPPETISPNVPMIPQGTASGRGVKRAAEVPVEDIDWTRTLPSGQDETNMEISCVTDLKHILEM